MVTNMFRCFISFCLCFTLFQTSFAAETTYTTPKAFMDLFYDVTGASSPAYPQNKINASQALIQSQKSSSAEQALMKGPLLLFMNSTLYVYDGNGKLLLKNLMRTAPNSGFFELTSLSHISVGLVYILRAKENGDTSWRSQLATMKQHIDEISAQNAKAKNNWLDQLNEPSWKPHQQEIQNMVNYACAMSSRFINDVLSNKLAFNQANLESKFFRGNTEFPIPYNNVMIGTFMLTATMSLNSLYQQVDKLNLDWDNSKVIIRFVAGQNVTAGVTAQSNWLVPAIKAMSHDALASDHIVIAPYALVKSSLGEKQLPAADLDYYNQVFAHVYNRTTAAKENFRFLPDVSGPQILPLPGDYGVTSKDNINDFLARLKYSLSMPTEMLSNTVVFWMAGEFAAKGWDINKIDIPGLTTGFPKGIKAYPNL